jgi:hypothetical protein
MRQPTAFFLLVALAAPGAALQAQAQSQEDRCNAFVSQHCGKRAVGECFAGDADWQAVPQACVGDVQTMIEMAREAKAQEQEDAALDRPGLVDRLDQAYGRSYGGVLRKGPGTSHPKLASVAPGERIRLLENTGVDFDGHAWFRVNTAHGEGYHWGGIFCSDGDAPRPGVLTVCGSEHEASLFGEAGVPAE